MSRYSRELTTRGRIRNRSPNQSSLRFESLEDRRLLAALTDATPFANASIPWPVANTRFPLTIDGSTSFDPQGDALIYSWSVTSAPRGAGFELDNPLAAIVNMTADTEGEYRVELVVSNGECSSPPFQFPIDFDDTQQDGGPYAIVEGQNLQLFGPTVVPVAGGETSWDISDGRFHGNDRLVTWAELEDSLSPTPAGVFPVDADVFIGTGAFSYYKTTLTVLPVGKPTTTDFPSANAVFGDIDGDGDLDAIGRANDQPGTQLQSFFNNGDGTFASQDTAPGESLHNSNASALFDFEGDGDLDLLVTPGTKPATLLLNEEGVFHSTTLFTDENSIFGAVETADIESDGDMDVLIVDEAGVGLYLNSGDQLSFDRVLFESTPVRDAIFADFDGNGLLDVLIERNNGEKEMWLNESGSFTEAVMPVDNLPNLASLNSTSADLDGDGDVDLVGADTVYLQDGSGVFFDASEAALGELARLREIQGLADFDGDGHVDILARFWDSNLDVVPPETPQLYILLNDGLATFSTELSINSQLNYPLGQMVIRDFDGDDHVDVLAPASPDSANGLIWFNQITPNHWHNSEFGTDVDDDGVISPVDPLLVINELNDREFSLQDSGILAIAPANIPGHLDTDNDGLVSPADALLPINALNSIGGGLLFAPLPDVTIIPNYPLMVPLDGLLSNGVDISYTVSSNRPGLVSGIIPDGNRSLKMSVSSPENGIDGEMIFQLFENYVPRITSRVIALAESGFYDGLTFHEIDGDHIRGGDPNGDGTGGSDLPDVDDQYHPDMRHSQAGVLTMVRPYEDANNSQFMIMNRSNNSHDFDFSPFGMLVEGEATRQRTGNVPASPAGNPTNDVIITNVEVIDDNQNRVLILRTPDNRDHGIAIITVTATSGGRSESRTFEVEVRPNGFIEEPYLEDIPTITTAVNTEVTYQLVGTDLSGFRTLNFLGPAEVQSIAGDFPVQLPPSDVIVSVDSAIGLITITPSNDYAGTFEFTVGLGTFRAQDLQTITVTVG